MVVRRAVTDSFPRLLRRTAVACQTKTRDAMALETIARKQAANPSPPEVHAKGAPYRTAPHHIELEQSLLAAILVHKEAFYRVSVYLEPRPFFEHDHQTLCDL